MTPITPLFTGVRGRGVLGSSYPASCIAPVLTGQDRRSRPRCWNVPAQDVVVLDRYADSWFIADSSLRGYHGVQTVRDKERSVGQKKLVRKAELPSRRGMAWPR